MSLTDSETLDLNLLACLDLLLAERSVTRAAARAGVTQSAMSHSLARLREALGDPLLVRSGGTLAPTPRAESLAAPLARALADLRRVVRDGGSFDAATSTRTFVLACPDLLAPLLPTLLERLRAAAPLVALEVRQPRGRDLARELASGACDLALGPAPEGGPGLVQRGLGSLRWCVARRRDHPLAGARLTLARWTAWPHVVVRSGSDSPSWVGRALEEAGAERRVGVVVPTFLAALLVASRTHSFFTAPRELLTPLAATFQLRLDDAPVTIPAMPVVALWHERLHVDAGHAWFRDLACLALRDSLSTPTRTAKPPRKTVTRKK